jgi:hypothetical protein
MIRNNPAGFLLSAASAQITGVGRDIRHTRNYGYLVYMGSAFGGASGGVSARFVIEGSKDNTGWMLDSTYTATATQTGTAQLAKFYPYLRARVLSLYSAGGGSGTGVVWVHYSPGL